MTFYRLIYRTPSKKKYALTFDCVEKLSRALKDFENQPYDIMVTRFDTSNGRIKHKSQVISS